MDDPAVIAGFRRIPDQEIEYRPVSPWSIVALILGVLSLAVVLLPVGIALGIVGMVIGGWSWRKIRQSSLAWAGERLAAAGLCLSFAAAAGGTSYQAWEARHQQYLRTLECPAGYLRLRLDTDFPTSTLAAAERNADVRARMAALDGTQVCVLGVGWLMGSADITDELLLLEETPHSIFGWSPRWQNTIRVHLREPADVWFPRQRVAASGTLRVNPKWSGTTGHEPAYLLEDAAIAAVQSRWD